MRAYCLDFQAVLVHVAWNCEVLNYSFDACRVREPILPQIPKSYLRIK
jgi:hypothetical protein